MIKRLMVCLLAFLAFGFTPIVSLASGVSPPLADLTLCECDLMHVNDIAVTSDGRADLIVGARSSLTVCNSGTALNLIGCPLLE